MIEIGTATAAAIRNFSERSPSRLFANEDALLESSSYESRERIIRTAERAARKNSLENWKVSERVAIKALAEAALTDDIVIQEYLAGVIAGATLDSDNAHLLSLVGRLTPHQLRLHYQIYLATVCLVRDESDPPGNWRSVSTRASIAFESDFIFEIPSMTVETDDVEDDWLRCYKALKQLEREDLIQINEERQYFEETIAFRITPLGVELLAASAGLIETDLDDLCLVHPKSLLFSPPLQALSVDRWTNYVDQLLIDHPEYLL